MTTSRSRLPGEVIKQRLAALPGWTCDRNRIAITRTYTFTEFLDGIAAVQDVAAVAEDLDHHPDIDIRWREVTFVCSTHSEGGVTELDLGLAGDIHQIATKHGGK